MTINLTDPANHPANGPLTVERIIRVREELQRTMFYANGGVIDYIVADAIKGLEELLVSREAVPAMYCSQETIAASKDGEHLLRTLSTPSGDCIIPLYTAAPVIADNWIPVSERMPTRSKEVLCAKEFDGPGDWRQKVGYWLAGKWTVYGASWTPTHWQPLPAAPKEVG